VQQPRVGVAVRQTIAEICEEIGGGGAADLDASDAAELLARPGLRGVFALAGMPVRNNHSSQAYRWLDQPGPGPRTP
jgi:hypothetical protein